ncbi:hypothetical protein AS361_04845 [Myroides marinus]|uniref:hypothetical protein n=1 Tax=Myroides marinus TaxID=703342 RepID=UPI0007422CC3|nr:hypothetical protein [Myroides marinus]KUF47181.1 hypothetical protein AS361_04845 [Myroides marinus]
MKDIIGDNFLDISSELLDIVYPLAIDFDEDFAFKCICWAQSNGGGWVSYYSENLEYVQKRWKDVLLYFPARKDQFYIDSVTNSGRNYGREKQYNVPIPNSTQFYFDCNQGEKAEDITKNYIEVLTKIFPNVNLSLPEYLQNLEEVSLFDILLSRLTWISPIVRYKAVESISELLESDKNGDYHKLFFEYLSYVGLENRCCEGLLVILKSLKNKDSFTFKYLSKVSLIDLISIKSLSIDMFVAQIYSILSVEYKPYELFINHVVNTNQSLDVDDLTFIKLIQSNLPSYYLNYIEEIQHHIGNSYDFLSMWSNQYQEYCNNFDLNKESDEESRYCHTKYQFMIGKCTIYGDILKSTFIRVVEYLYNIRCLNFYYLKEYLLKSLPIDILMSDIKKGTKPNWWPEITIPKEFVKSKDYTKEVLDFIRSRKQEVPLYFHGSYSTKYEFYNSNTYCEIEAITFMTKELKSDIKSLGLSFVYKQIANFGAWYVNSHNLGTYHSFENNLMFKGFCSSELFNSLVSPMKSSLNNVWQYYRAFNPMYLLSPLLSSTLDLVIDKGTLKYEENGKIIAHCNDFLVKFKDTSYYEEPMPYNNYLMINRDFINQISIEYEMKLMVIVKQTIFVKDRRNQDDVFDTIESFKIIEL